MSIRLVARRAGCSVSTVSRVINRSGPASPQARARVESAIADLGFKPNVFGQSLRTQRSRTIGVIVPSFTNPVFAASVAGLEAIARGHGRQLVLSSTDYDADREEERVETLLNQRVEGLVLTVADANSSRALDRLDREGMPYVLLYNQPAPSLRHAVTVDNHAATATLTRHLITLGHQRMAYIAGRFRTSDRSRLRFGGCETALAEASLAAPGLLELDYLSSIEEHARVLNGALAQLGNPTALLCSNDLLAISVIAALRSLDRRVPADVSVAGFDGIAFGRMVSPSLATIDTPTVAMGERAMQRLFNLISGTGETAPAVELLPYEFRAGGTLAPVPGEVPRCLSDRGQQKAGGGERRRHAHRR